MAVYSVAQLTGYLSDLLKRDSLLSDVWVRGEVANLARPVSGNYYYTLRDSSASLRCVMFGRRSRGAELLTDGAAVIAHGRIAIYEVRGELQLVADIVQQEGVGDLQLRLEQLKLQLENEGLFDQSRKRPIPQFPQRVGVVTSPTGAVWQDIQTVIRRRYPLVEVLLAPSAVQGESAAPSIIDALEALDGEPDIDVVILARGGGSLEDLWSFNEEAVARAVFASKAPVISAVGHETDVTIADLVADLRAPTPSVAAEMAVPDQFDLSAGLLASRQTLTTSLGNGLRGKGDALGHSLPRLQRASPDLDGLRFRIDDLLHSVAVGFRRGVEQRSERAGGLAMRLRALSPRDTLRRGYAIVNSPDGAAVIIDSAQVSPGDRVEVTLAKGGFEADVVDTRSDGPRRDGDPVSHALHGLD
jgi:exodeoxyribonuclease VII large subunit